MVTPKKPLNFRPIRTRLFSTQGETGGFRTGGTGLGKSGRSLFSRNLFYQRGYILEG